MRSSCSDKAVKTLLVIPVYNHGATLNQVVERALETGFPVLVVDDGSTDRGPETLAGLPCRVHRMETNMGKGAAILEGAKIARDEGFDAMVTVDADGQHDPRDAVRLVEEASMDWPCMVIGDRGNMKDPDIPGASRFGRAFSNFWVRLECGLDLPDTQSGFRLYPVKLLLELPVRSRRYDFEVEVIVRAVWAGVPVRSVPISIHYPRQEERVSHFKALHDNLRLTLLHTMLVLRALSPLPHRRLLERPQSEKMSWAVKHPLKLLKRLCKEHSSPLLLGTAVWMGLFMGALPLIACHTVAIIYVTHKLNLNKIAAVAASQFCCPPVVPMLCIEAGHLMRFGHLLTEVTWDTAVFQIHERLWEWLLGSLIVGPVLGLLGGGIVYAGARYYRGQALGAGGAGDG